MKRLSVWISLAVLCCTVSPASLAQTVSGSAEQPGQPVFLSQADMTRVSRECLELAALSNQPETRQLYESKQQLTQSIVRTIGPVVRGTAGIKGRCVVGPGAQNCEIAPSIYIEIPYTGARFFHGDKLDFEFSGPAKIYENKFLEFTGRAMLCGIKFQPTSPRFTLAK